MATPAAPANFVVIRSEDRTSALLMWDTLTMSPAVTSYNVHKSLVNNGLLFASEQTVSQIAGITRQCTTVDSLDPDIVYNFKIRAINSDGNGAFSDEDTDF